MVHKPDPTLTPFTRLPAFVRAALEASDIPKETLDAIDRGEAKIDPVGAPDAASWLSNNTPTQFTTEGVLRAIASFSERDRRLAAAGDSATLRAVARFLELRPAALSPTAILAIRALCLPPLPRLAFFQLGRAMTIEEERTRTHGSLAHETPGEAKREAIHDSGGIVGRVAEGMTPSAWNRAVSDRLLEYARTSAIVVPNLPPVEVTTPGSTVTLRAGLQDGPTFSVPLRRDVYDEYPVNAVPFRVREVEIRGARDEGVLEIVTSEGAHRIEVTARPAAAAAVIVYDVATPALRGDFRSVRFLPAGSPKAQAIRSYAPNVMRSWTENLGVPIRGVATDASFEARMLPASAPAKIDPLKCEHFGIEFDPRRGIRGVLECPCGISVDVRRIPQIAPRCDREGNDLADRLQVLEDEKRTVLAENATLRREIEALKRKSGKR